MEFNFKNVNDAFYTLVKGIHEEEIPTVKEESRVGNVIKINSPVLICYERPWERVLFNNQRDCNPFFHLFESMWMLAGRNDTTTLKDYNSNIIDIASDDGETFNGAYGYRWRLSSVDQIDWVINHLAKNPKSRRAVIQMWNVEDDLMLIEESKDVCCNLSVLFSLREEKQCLVLDMTVTNRSNDLIWGCLGANVVHFSFLQEYVAQKLGALVGKYYQFTNNLHVYEKNWEPEKWLSEYEGRTLHSSIVNYTDRVKRHIQPYGVGFDEELETFVDFLTTSDDYRLWASHFLTNVAQPMKMAFAAHKDRGYGGALLHCEMIMDDAWREACTRWIERRQAKWENSNRWLAS